MHQFLHSGVILHSIRMELPLRKRVFVRTPKQSQREAVPVILAFEDTMATDLSAFYAAVQAQQGQLVSGVKATGYAVHHIDGPLLNSPYFMMHGDHIVICTRNEDYSKKHFSQLLTSPSVPASDSQDNTVQRKGGSRASKTGRSPRIVSLNQLLWTVLNNLKASKNIRNKATRSQHHQIFNACVQSEEFYREHKGSSIFTIRNAAAGYAGLISASTLKQLPPHIMIALEEYEGLF